LALLENRTFLSSLSAEFRLLWPGIARHYINASAGFFTTDAVSMLACFL
jgi:hypothetical protein